VADKVRSAVAPNVPTMIEAGVPDHVAVQWNGLLVLVENAAGHPGQAL